MSDQVAVVAEKTPAERVMGLEGADRQDWLKTGKLPDLAASEAVDSNKDSNDSTETPAESSPATPEKAAEVEVKTIEKQEQSRKVSKSERRYLELLNENKRLKAEAASKVEVAATPKAVADKVEPAAKETPDKPALASYQTYEDWVEAVSDWKADQKITARLEQDRQAREAAAKQSEIEAKNKAIEKTWMDRVEAAKKRHSDYEDVAFAAENTSEIKQGTVLDGWILDSEHGAELFYYMASNPEEIVRINGLTSPFMAARELTKLEATFEKAPAKVNAVTKAPKPPSEVSGNGTVADDPADVALARGNFRAYFDEANRKELKTSRRS